VPPVLANAVQLSIVHTDWKTTSLMQDLRAPGNTTQTWDMTVTSPKPNDTVTLSWANLAKSVPRNYRLTLVDKDTNTRQNLSSTASYVVNTGTSGTRCRSASRTKPACPRRSIWCRSAQGR